MNPITNMKNLNKMNEREIEMGVAGTQKSWHNQVRMRYFRYKNTVLYYFKDIRL